jgi:hypothetical protein
MALLEILSPTEREFVAGEKNWKPKLTCSSFSKDFGFNIAV